MSNAYKKVQSAAKSIESDPKVLQKTVLQTLKEIADIVGSTLGPGGKVVLIERQEYNYPPVVTKDGVTVHRSLGFQDPMKQMIMESSRESAVRTATEAGDGTTTATILAYSIAREIFEYCKANPKVSPQKVVRTLKNLVDKQVMNAIQKQIIKPDFFTSEGKDLLRKVATISANGDTALADAVIQCFELVGDNGNVTIQDETASTSGFMVERVEGYPIPMGWNDSCEPFSAKFLNDVGNQRTLLQHPLILVNFGQINSVEPFVQLFDTVAAMAQARQLPSNNIVLVATGFSEQVKGDLAVNFAAPNSQVKVFPLLAPMFPTPDGMLGFMRDLCVVTGQKVLLDPMSKSYASIVIEDLGRAKAFECYRFRSNIYGSVEENELNILEQVDILKKQMGAASLLEKSYLQERIGKLTGGIARLRILGSSVGELRERKDRADDAVCAVRGAIKRGILPGGASVLTHISGDLILESDPAVNNKSIPEAQILVKAFQEPLMRLMENAGYNDDQIMTVVASYVQAAITGLTGEADLHIFDVMKDKWVRPIEGGLLDSAPAVIEAITNSLSIASQLGTLGGLVAFARDDEFERQESKSTHKYLRDAGALE
jgi:chaperonin GroEL